MTSHPSELGEVAQVGYLVSMTEEQHSHNPDQDAEPPTPDGKEPDTDQLDPDSEPASDPDPEPGASSS